MFERHHVISRSKWIVGEVTWHIKNVHSPKSVEPLPVEPKLKTASRMRSRIWKVPRGAECAQYRDLT